MFQNYILGMNFKMQPRQKVNEAEMKRHQQKFLGDLSELSKSVREHISNNQKLK